MKTRIITEQHADGKIVYFVQYRTFLFWRWECHWENRYWRVKRHLTLEAAKRAAEDLQRDHTVKLQMKAARKVVKTDIINYP
jgi:hypothetical protein